MGQREKYDVPAPAEPDMILGDTLLSVPGTQWTLRREQGQFLIAGKSLVGRIATAITTASFIAALSFATPVKEVFHTVGRFHLWWHCLTFALAGLGILYGVSGTRRQGSLAIACMAFGCCLEVLEHIVYRTPGVEVADILADASGVIIGWLILRLYQRQVSFACRI
jgi:hypothetical protein